GNTTFATSTVLAGYMAGLGIGALFFGKFADKSRINLIRLYGILEGGVALYAFLTPLVWKLIDQLQLLFYSWVHPSFFQNSLFIFSLSFISFFIPTFFICATFLVIS